MLRIFRHQQQTKKNRKLKIQNSAVASASAEHCSRVYVPETGQAEDCWTKIDDFLYAILSFYSSDDDDDHTHTRHSLPTTDRNNRNRIKTDPFKTEQKRLQKPVS